MKSHLTAVAASAVILLAGPPAAGQTTREIVRLGKAATALLEVGKPKTSASAVCVHSSGVFVTSQHAVAGVPWHQPVKLILNPNTPNQLEVGAQVVRQAPELDLAALRVVGQFGREFETLEIGDDSQLFETMAVTGFGFPFGRSLAERDALPSISVNVGRITSLRMKEGRLSRIQLDVALNPGNSGGPVVDDQGKIVGIVKSGVLGTGVNFAVPSSEVRDFLSRPDVRVRPSVVPRSQLHGPVEFTIELVQLLSSEKELTVNLKLQANGREERYFQATPVGGGKYTVRATPVLRKDSAEPRWLRGSVRLAGGSVKGAIRDQDLTVGDVRFRLSDVRSIDFGETLKVRLHDDTRINGTSPNFPRLKIDIGGPVVDLDLGQVGRLEMARPSRESMTLRYEVFVRHARTEVVRSTGKLPVVGPILPGTTRSEVVTFDKERKSIQLPATIQDAVLARDGKSLLLQLENSKAVGVFDFDLAKIVRYIPIGTDDFHLAGGLDKFIVLKPSEGVIERWSLATLQKETTRAIPIEGLVKAVAMGYASRGPLLVKHRTPGSATDVHTLVDLDSLKAKAPSFRTRGFSKVARIRASATGSVFGQWGISGSPQGVETITLQEGSASTVYKHRSMGHVLPSYDGSKILTGIAGVLTPDLEQERSGRHMPAIPTTHHRFYVAVPADPKAMINLGPKPFAGMKPALYEFSSDVRLVNLPDLSLGDGPQNPLTKLTLDKRVIFSWEANQLVSIPFSNDRILVQRFDPIDRLISTDSDFFFVYSTPPREFIRGQRYQHIVEVATSRAGAQFELTAGPEGMRINESGVLTWDTPANFQDKRVKVTISIKNRLGRSTVEEFSISARELAPTPAQ